MAETESNKPQDSRGRPKTRVGVVTSNKMQKTVIVTVRRRAAHADYGKIQTKRVKYKAHAENHEYPKNIALHEGDKVLISETRPMSKDKRWRVMKVLERSTNA
jgi:small subunit ribosomal protein S17